MKVKAEKRKRVTDVWRRVLICVEPVDSVDEDAGAGEIDLDCAWATAEETGSVNAFRKTQFLLNKIPISRTVQLDSHRYG